jgi:hypothetical protein
VGRVCRVKRFETGSRNAVNVSLMMKRFKWRCGSGWGNCQKTSVLRVSTHCLRRWDKRISVGGGYVEKWMFFPYSNITCFTF